MTKTEKTEKIKSLLNQLASSEESNQLNLIKDNILLEIASSGWKENQLEFFTNGIKVIEVTLDDYIQNKLLKSNNIVTHYNEGWSVPINIYSFLEFSDIKD